ncbi:hypothetical protein H6G54_29015 [Anabaena cylindrica FACHB-243]|uniref:Nuclease SbcCD subunit C n=1 Tax=Anabaena cylindrica (strain ATCC 27899 / PCC 7122) TaxID=272123 RepID=K9ZPQ0_ANACC|nr:MULTISPECIES: hypothetical protein [Anabaena]AFZ61171.1 hypothetical protein Anacy_5880 [Anabaena cylindrica PCC 7122]MBD2421647.1 hypothetical protein [Anabaena cylindrica FACHB-243]MBY5280454.1 hypothetical protein [Anabaena sp. CCAP 1446/1C]MBY5308185.1 hypothetical protein [Anabaena sp. CCAP 1446/1C]MCM2405451.1 hypothetical protein [Anabaena sp. CCAP 1446/1C]
MALQLRYLSLRITTSDGLFGVEIPFEAGLFVLHADNTSGKSTCLQSILYALGLEGMLSSTQNIPLPAVVTDFLDYDGQTYHVLESEVLLEISNGTKVITVRRQIKGRQDKHLINVWMGPMLSQTGTSYISSDYIVRQPGAASREIGFHHLLAEFIGWKLPNVPTYNESETLLYMETLFPLMFVEQKYGWSSLRNRFPTYFKIKELNRRAFEFITSLDAEKNAAQKIFLQQEAKNINTNWSVQIEAINRLVASINGLIDNLPTKPISDWPPSVQPEILIFDQEKRINIKQVIFGIEERLQYLNLQEVPSVEQVSKAAQQELQDKQEQLLKIETEIKFKFEEVERQIIHIEAIELRIVSLKEELLKNKDLKKLLNLGSTQDLQTHSGKCPTCYQSISDSLISIQEINNTMTIEENIDFIEEQLKVFNAMSKSEVKTLDLKKRQLNGLKSYVAEIRQDIRSLKTTLTSQSNAPSYAVIEERVRLAEKIRYIKLIRSQVDEVLGKFSQLSEEWREVQTRLASLPKEIFSKEDKSKISDLERSFQQQLQEYGFGSLNPINITISLESYFPEYEGFDLQFNLSASDYIRIIWAYLLGLLEVSRQHETNHLGLLILDEPRQQSAREASIEAFLYRASLSQQYGQQVIIATSESSTVLTQYLRNVPHTYKRFDGKIIAPL